MDSSSKGWVLAVLMLACSDGAGSSAAESTQRKLVFERVTGFPTFGTELLGTNSAVELDLSAVLPQLSKAARLGETVYLTVGEIRGTTRGGAFWEVYLSGSGEAEVTSERAAEGPKLAGVCSANPFLIGHLKANKHITPARFAVSSKGIFSSIRNSDAKGC